MVCSRCVLALVVLSGMASAARADISAFAVEYDQFDHNRTVADGVLAPNDYQWNSQYFQGSGSGAGGVLGGANARLYFSVSDQGIVLGFQPGAALNGTLVVLVDAGAGGGRSAGSGSGLATLNDSADPARSAISSLRGHFPTTNAFDDRYEYAVTFNTDGAAAWAMPGDSGSTVAPLGTYAGGTGVGTLFREALIPIANPGWNSIGGFALFAAYIGSNGYIYNETLPAQPFSSSPNPGTGSTIDFTNAALVAEFIPAPATSAAFLIALLVSRRRRSFYRRGQDVDIDQLLP